MVGTDSKFYTKISKNSYRFSPMSLVQNDVDSIHGFNERISFENYYNFIDYFYNLIINFDKL
jgi:carboxypeptidase PM20D1